MDVVNAVCTKSRMRKPGRFNIPMSAADYFVPKPAVVILIEIVTTWYPPV
jgi:hypothetical protein